MKIIALLPVKNEAWVLPSYLSSVGKIADLIIVLDDTSTDESTEILKSAGVTVLAYDSTNESIINMGKRRQILLEAGRSAGGTHFIWLDADETFSSNFISKAQEIILDLRPGEKISMRWVHAWKDTEYYLNDTRSPFGYIWKDFIVCDDASHTFEEKFLSEARTPGTHEKLKKIPEEMGVVIHWQFSNWEALQMKQAYYRCTELIEGTRSARRINNTYSCTLDTVDTVKQQLPTHWIENIAVPNKRNHSNWHFSAIQDYFKLYGINFFEPLQIWHIPELHTAFIETEKREPISYVFPSWLIKLNKLRHYILGR